MIRFGLIPPIHYGFVLDSDQFKISAFGAVAVEVKPKYDMY
jgi:hypothetical protein